MEESERIGGRIQEKLQEAGQRLEDIGSRIEEHFNPDEPPRGRGGESDNASGEDTQAVEDLGRAEERSSLVR